MHRLLLALMLAVACDAAVAADFASVQPTLAKNGCLSCHDVQGKVNGPSFHDIAARYVSRPDARSYLADKIRNGSENTWGAAAMPPNPGVDDLEMKTIVDWLVAGAPGPAK